MKFTKTSTFAKALKTLKDTQTLEHRKDLTHLRRTIICDLIGSVDSRDSADSRASSHTVINERTMCELTRRANNNRKKTVNSARAGTSLLVYSSRAIVPRPVRAVAFVPRPVRAVAYILNYMVKYTGAYNRTDEERVAQILLEILENSNNAQTEESHESLHSAEEKD